MEESQVRWYFIETLTKIADPVLYSLGKNESKERMPVETASQLYGDRRKVSHLEAFGRTLSGIAPWLELGPYETKERKLREKYIPFTLKAIENATNPESPDYLDFHEGDQAFVDAAFFAQGLLRAPEQLWERLDNETKLNVINALKQTKTLSPV